MSGAAGPSHVNFRGVGLLLVDVQYDFIDGALAVQGANDILAPTKHLIEAYPWALIAASQDYHPPRHVSFASTHPDGPGPLQPFSLPHPNRARAQRGDTITQMLWPDHCVQGTQGAAIHDEIMCSLEARKRCDGVPVHIVQKGTDIAVDGYSAFADNAYLGFSGLPRLLFSAQPEPIHTLVVAGLATDYCVLASALDSVKFHLRTLVVQGAVRGVAAASISGARDEMRAAGIELIGDDDGSDVAHALQAALAEK